MKHKRNFIYTYIYPSDSHHYGYLEVSEYSLSVKDVKPVLEEGFAPAVKIYQSFDDFLKNTRDF